jgi:integrase
MPRLDRRLTDTIAKKCAVPKLSYAIYWCPVQPGFGVRVTHEGFRSWVIERRDLNGKTKRVTLGAVSGTGKGRNVISAELARRKAVQESGDISEGIDRRAEQRDAAKREERDGLTFEQALRQYIDDDGARERPLKERTKTDYVEMVWQGGVNGSGRMRKPGELASIANKRIDSIGGADMKVLYRELQRRGRTRAAYAVRVLRAVQRYHGVKLADDPFARDQAGRDRIRLPRANQRKRVIPPERLGNWWKAASDAPSGDKFMFMLLTGLRPGETAQIKASDVDLGGGRIPIVDTKNGKAHTVLLSRQAKRIAAARMKGREPNEPLFEADPRDSQNKIIKASGVPFSPHDCRRTFASIAANLVPELVLKSLLNHAAGNDVTQGHYVHLDEATMRGAWQKLADTIDKLASQRQPRRGEQKVVPIIRAAVAA